MRIITLTASQRLNLDALLSAQRGKLDDLMVCHDVRKKIKLPAEMREELVKALPDGRVMVDEARLTASPNIDVELENEEIRRINKLLNTWENFGEGDVEWVSSLKEQLNSPTKSA